MGHRAKLLFCSVFFNEFHHRTKLMAFLISTFAFQRQLGIPKLRVLRVPPIQIPTQNGEMKKLLGKFHHRTNLMALLFSNSKNKTIYAKL
jgi:hypothetical protein